MPKVSEKNRRDFLGFFGTLSCPKSPQRMESLLTRLFVTRGMLARRESLLFRSLTYPGLLCGRLIRSLRLERTRCMDFFSGVWRRRATHCVEDFGDFGGCGGLDEGQITHPICARLKYDLYDFFRGSFWACFLFFSCRKGPKTPPKKVI